MKKLALALVCLVSVAFFASCSPEGDPTISIYDTEDGYVKSGSNIIVGEEFKYGFDLASSVETDKELSSLVVSITLPDGFEEKETLEFPGEVTEYTFRRTYTVKPSDKNELLGVVKITAIVTDVAGKTASVSMDLNLYQSDALTLGSFSWQRKNGAPGTGLEEFGLKWTSNEKEIFAVIEPMEGATLYSIPAEKWSTVTTQAQKEALFVEGIAQVIKDYRGVSMASTQEYNDVIATLYKDTYYMFNIQKCTVERYTFTIEGQWK